MQLCGVNNMAQDAEQGHYKEQCQSQKIMLELINGKLDQVMETWSFGVQHRLQTTQKEQNGEEG